MAATPDPTETTATPGEPLLRTVDLTRHFRLGGLFSQSALHAVDDLNISIQEREIVALVGESGSGKSTVARLLARIYKPTSGEIYYRGRPVRSLRSRKDFLWYRGEVPIVLQDPFSAFHPVFRVSHGVMRNLALHRPELSGDEREREAERACEAVGLSPKMLTRFPYEMSGGERQRIGFAQALAVGPKLILADEPVSMLDVSIRIGVLNMMAGLRDREGVSILYITHDLASARYVADRVVVMYAGHQVEDGPDRDGPVRPQAPVHAAAHVGRSRSKREGSGDLRRHRRSAAGDRSERGLPLPVAVSVRDREVRAGHAPPEADRVDAGRVSCGDRRHGGGPRPRRHRLGHEPLKRSVPGSVELVIFDATAC